VPLPPDWGPDAKTQQFAIERLGDEAAVDRCFAKFRVHHETSGQQWTPRGWQSRARGWVLKEEQFFGPQRSLPLMRVPRTTKLADAAAVAAKRAAAESDPAWAPIYARLKAEHGESVASSWFAKAKLGALSGHTATVLVPTQFLASWLRDQYAAQVLSAIRAEHPDVTEVRFMVAQAAAEERSAHGSG
jgi:hypothetical protein